MKAALQRTLSLSTFQVAPAALGPVTQVAPKPEFQRMTSWPAVTLVPPRSAPPRATSPLRVAPLATVARTTPVPVLGSLQFKGLSPGGGHTCGVTQANDVYCWGFNLSGQLGDGGAADRATPGQISGTQKMTSVLAGGAYTCALTSAGASFCWGWNQSGQLGDGTAVDQATPKAVSGGLVFTQLSVGSFHTCGVTAAGQAYCWGRNEFGQLGDSTTVDHRSPAVVKSSINFVAVEVGFTHSCGVASDDSAHCWGRNNFLQLGLGPDGDPQVLAPRPVTGGHTFAQIDAGAVFTCGIEAGTGAAFCWGFNGSGQLGANVPGTCTDESGFPFQCTDEPTAVSGGLSFASISAATQHVCGLTTGGIAYCWGLGSEGQLGDGSKGDQVFTIQPVRVAGQPGGE